MQSGAGASSSRTDVGTASSSFLQVEDTEGMISDLTAPTALRKLVLNYLVHHCYIDTAQAFVDDGSGGGASSSSSSGGSGGAALSPTSAAMTKAPPRGTDGGERLPVGPGPSSNGHASTSSSSATRRHAGTRSGHGHGGSTASSYTHPLAAPPLSRDDSSMDVEVDSLLSLASNGQGSASEAAAGRSDDELSAEELNSVRIRRDVRDCILTGRIGRAIELLNHHFPTVLPVSASSGSKEPASSAATSQSQPKEDRGNGRTRTASAKEEAVESLRILPSNPTSLDPLHLWLNMHIQAFIESMRAASSLAGGSSTSPYPSASLFPPSSAHQGASAMPSMHSLVSGTPGIAAAAISRSASPAPSSASSSTSINSGNGMSGSMHSASGPGGSNSSHTVGPAVQNALAHARWLFEQCQKLPGYWRAMYLKELENVTAMLAYSDLESSPMRKYLDQNRRVALAEQINSAIIFRTGKPSQALIESAVRQTTFCWWALHDENIGVPPSHGYFSSGVASAVAGADASLSAAQSNRASGGDGTNGSAGGVGTSGGSTGIATKNKGKLQPRFDLRSFLAI